MKIDIKYRPVNSVANVRLEAGERIQAEPGAMIGMSTHVDMKTDRRKSTNEQGGLLGKIASAAKSMAAGESFLTNTFTASGKDGEVLLAPALSGDIFVEEVPETGITMQSGAYIANTMGVELDTEVGGAKTFFGGESLFVIKATAREPGEHIVIGAYGGIEEMEVDGSVIIDTGHLVAWDSTLNLNVQKASGGWISSFLSGEGRVFEITGRGRVWIQTRHPVEFGQAMGQKLPPRQ